MKVLMVSMDRGVLETGNEAAERMTFYSSVFEELAIIVLNSSGTPVRYGNITVYPTSLNKLVSFFQALSIGSKLLKRNPFNVISSQDPFGAGLVGYILKLLFKTPLQLQVHTGLFTPYFFQESGKNRLYVFLARLLLPRANCVKVVSHGIKQYLVTRLGIDPAKISVLPVYTSFEQFEKGQARIHLKEKYPEFEFIVLMASRLVKQKNISLALQAIHKLASVYPRLGLVIVGSGPHENNLKKETRELGIEENVRFEPWTNDMVSYYKSADVFLLTSNYEGWARTILEAMASGLPTIMTGIYIGVASEAIESGKNGIVTPVGDAAAIVSAIEDLYNSPEKRMSMSLEAIKTIKTLEFRDKKKYLELYLESYKPCCETK